MDDLLLSLLRQPTHPWESAVPTIHATVQAALPGAPSHLSRLFHRDWPGDLVATMDWLGSTAGVLPAAVGSLLWAGLALHLRADQPTGFLRTCRVGCRGGEESEQVGGEVLATILQGHAEAGEWSGTRRLGDALGQGRLLDRERAMRLAMRGQATPLLRQPDLLATLAEGDEGWVQRLRFFDAVECGRVAEASGLAAQVSLSQHPAEARLIRAYTALAWLTQAVLGRHLPDPVRTLEGPSAPWRHIGDPVLEQRVRAIFVSVLGRSEDLAGLADQPEPDDRSLDLSGHFSVLPIRLALAQGQSSLATRLLARRRSIGCSTWLDQALDLRLRLQIGDRIGASNLVGGLVASSTASDAASRVDFELRAAGEVSPLQLVQLSLPDAKPTTTAKPANHGLVGSSPAMQRVGNAIARYAEADLPVLLRGASGTGKELAAKALHAASGRRRQPFVAVNCAAIAETLLESELFGHVRGSFSGASASRPGLIAAAGAGTLFLDEIGEVSRHFQAALLRLLELGEYRQVGADAGLVARCRIIAATNADLGAMVASGRFREDLYHRLCRFEIRLPALAERLDDLNELVPHLLGLARGGRPAQADPALINHLRARAWPGNVRELRNRLEAMVALHPRQQRYGLQEFTASDPPYEDVPRQSVVAARSAADGPPPDSSGKSQRLAALRDLLRERHRVTRVEVAKRLGIAPMTATAYLRELCDGGELHKVMPNPAPRSHYFEVAEAPPG